MNITSSHQIQNANHGIYNNALTQLTLVEKPKVYLGYMNGFRQPVAAVLLKVASFNLEKMQILQNTLNGYFDEYGFKCDAILSNQDYISCFGELICFIQKTAGYTIFETKQIEIVSEELAIFKLWVPCLHEEAFHQIMSSVLYLFTQQVAFSLNASELPLHHEVKELFEYLKRHAPKGVNSARLLKAAHQQNIPWRHLTQNVYQYGYGRHSRWFDSTLTDQTSHLGAALSKSKHNSNLFLKKFGFPVPEQYIVGNELEAIEVANKVGFPVVIKPNSQENGRGVSPGLASEYEVSKAFVTALRYGPTVLLEKHITGKDYRVFILNGKLVYAIERIPAHVIGDGVRNINKLIEIENELRIRATQDERVFQIKITETMKEYLADQGYDLYHIPERDQHIPLNRISNISSGGKPVNVLDRVHLDNKRLVETLTDLMRLNIVGIDIIMPDIQQSYLGTGGAIIEVNAQPQLGIVTAGHMYTYLLTSLLPNRGRIPIIVVCSPTTGEILIHKMLGILSQQYQNIGVAKNRSAYLNGNQIQQSTSLFHATNVLLSHPELDALIYCIHDVKEIEFQGLPFDQYDCLLMLNQSHFSNDDSRKSMKMLLQACRGQQITFNNNEIPDDLENNLLKWLLSPSLD